MLVFFCVCVCTVRLAAGICVAITDKVINNYDKGDFLENKTINTIIKKMQALLLIG